MADPAGEASASAAECWEPVNMHIRILVVAGFVVTGLQAGCSDKPGALQMSVTPDAPEFGEHSLIRLRCDLSSDEAVCLPRNYDVRVEMRRVDADEDSIHPSACRRFRCGSEYFALLPLVPAIVVGRLLDVGDLGGRFQVIAPGEARSCMLEIGGGSTTKYWLNNWPPDDLGTRPTDACWTPGEYRVTVSLNNYNGFAPLFWKPYSQPVQAEAFIQITDTSTEPAVVEPTIQAGVGD